MILATLNAFPQVTTIEGSTVILDNGLHVKVTPLTDDMVSVPQPTGGARIFTGSEQSFHHCFDAYLT